ncbi:hypothetical protein ACFHYQ_11500, partial [Sphaerimonospora cavernae]
MKTADLFDPDPPAPQARPLLGPQWWAAVRAEAEARAAARASGGRVAGVSVRSGQWSDWPDWLAAVPDTPPDAAPSDTALSGIAFPDYVDAGSFVANRMDADMDAVTHADHVEADDRTGGDAHADRAGAEGREGVGERTAGREDGRTAPPRDGCADGPDPTEAAEEQTEPAETGPVEAGAEPEGAETAGTGAAESGAAESGAGSWPLVSAVRESALALALTAVPDAPDVCLAQLEELIFARDRLEAAIAVRVQRVHAAGAARERGHASTRTWLRSVCGTSRRVANRVVGLGMELERLAQVKAGYAAGSLSEAVVSAICAATAGLSDADAANAEQILLELAEAAGPE